MILPKQIELWNGKEVVGYVYTMTPPQRQHMVFPTISELKREYNKTYETIEVPIIIRVVSDNGIDFHLRKCLDVRKKGKRQLEILKNFR